MIRALTTWLIKRRLKRLSLAHQRGYRWAWNVLCHGRNPDDYLWRDSSSQLAGAFDHGAMDAIRDWKYKEPFHE